MPKKHVDHSRKFLIRILHLKGKKKWARKLECFVTNKSREARLVRDYCGMVRESKVVPMSREWSEALKGGAYGAHMTKRKRKTRPSSGTEGDGSLAGALQSFLQKWEAGAPTKVRKTESKQKNNDTTLASQLLVVLQQCMENQQQDRSCCGSKN